MRYRLFMVASTNAAQSESPAPTDLDTYHGPCRTADCAHDATDCGAPECDGCDPGCRCETRAEDDGEADWRYDCDRDDKLLGQGRYAPDDCAYPEDERQRACVVSAPRKPRKPPCEECAFARSILADTEEAHKVRCTHRPRSMSDYADDVVIHFELTDHRAACGRKLPTAGFFTPSATDFELAIGPRCKSCVRVFERDIQEPVPAKKCATCGEIGACTISCGSGL